LIERNHPFDLLFRGRSEPQRNAAALQNGTDRDAMAAELCRQLIDRLPRRVAFSDSVGMVVRDPGLSLAPGIVGRGGLVTTDGASKREIYFSQFVCMRGEQPHKLERVLVLRDLHALSASVQPRHLSLCCLAGPHASPDVFECLEGEIFDG